MATAADDVKAGLEALIQAAQFLEENGGIISIIVEIVTLVYKIIILI